MTRPEAVVQHELIEQGLGNLDARQRDYLLGGTESETTVLRNRQAIDRLAFQPSVLQDVSKITLQSPCLSTLNALPIFCAPIGALNNFWADGESAAAKAASDAQIPFWYSSLSSKPLKEMVSEAKHSAIYQLYVRGDANWVDDRIRAVADAGFSAICLTVDSAAYSRRERDLVARYEKPYRTDFTPKAMAYQASLTWEDIERVQQLTKLPLILKGIASPRDAKTAAAIGVDVIYVSNHGGRQLDHAMGSFDTLRDIVSAVDDRAKVFVDGGVMRGTDVIKAIALGADMVGIGRLYCLALAAGGYEGVSLMIKMLRTELEKSLALVGAATFADLHSDMVRDMHSTVQSPHIFSPFPHLSL